MSLMILQAKTLMALYEHLQGNHIAAIGTISSASASAKAMGYFQWHCRGLPNSIEIDKEGERVTCCLYTLER